MDPVLPGISGATKTILKIGSWLIFD